MNFTSSELSATWFKKYMEYYNTKRLKAKIKMSPVQYEATE
ncbi:TPA: IS3 family transposase [Clostridioides difficile]